MEAERIYPGLDVIITSYMAAVPFDEVKRHGKIMGRMAEGDGWWIKYTDGDGITCASAGDLTPAEITEIEILM